MSRPDRNRLLTTVRDITLGLAGVLIGIVVAGPIGAVVGVVAGGIVGLVWRSADDRAAERRAAALEAQVRELSRPESAAAQADRLHRDIVAKIRSHSD